MARSSLVFLMGFMVFASFMSSSYGRRLLATQEINKEEVPSPEDRLYRTSLPKGTVTPSSPSKKGHANMVDETLVARHLIAVDRILRSVPSPGVGH